MIIRYNKAGDPGGPGEVGKSQEKQTGAGNDDACRCKEASAMTPRELLKLMMNDLVFWKKAQKG